MKKAFRILPLIVVGCITTFIGKSQTDTTISIALVKKSVLQFERLIGSDDAQEYGLSNKNEFKILKPGRQLKKYVIGLSAIKKYQQGQNVSNMLIEYPVVEVLLASNAGKIGTSIEFSKRNGQWEASRFGSTPEVVLLKEAQGLIADSTLKRAELIRIPSLRVSFVGIAGPHGLEFISLQDRGDLNLFKGIREPAGDIMLKLVAAARQHKNLPN